MALLRGDRTLVPDGATDLEDEDVLLVLGEDGDLVKDWRRIER